MTPIAGLCTDRDCVSCGNFERHIQSVDSVPLLKAMRRSLVADSVPPKGSKVEEFAGWVAYSVVYTGAFFVLCNLLPFVVFIWPQEEVYKTVNFVSSNWWQLALLPLIGLAMKRKERIDDHRDERQYRMLLIGERIDELDVKR